jgi:flagellar basal body rod protein FlgG
MQIALHTAASGLRHADGRQRATAHNTANLTTPESVVLRTIGSEHADGRGVEPHMEGRVERRRGASSAAVEYSVAQISTLHSTGALANVVRTTDDMLGSLLDILG